MVIGNTYNRINLIIAVLFVLVGVVVASLQSLKWTLFVVIIVVFGTYFISAKYKIKLALFVIAAISFSNYAYYPVKPSLEYYFPDTFGIYFSDIPLFFLLATYFYLGKWSNISRTYNISKSSKIIAIGFSFCVWIFATSAIAGNSSIAVLESIKYFRLFLITFVICYFVAGNSSVQFLLLGLFLGLAVESSLAVLQYFYSGLLGPTDYMMYDGSEGSSFSRSSGTMNPTVLAEYIGVICPFALSASLYATTKWRLSFFTFFYLLSLLACLLTFSRGGWLNVALSSSLVILLSILCFRKQLVLVRLKICIGFVLFLVLSFFVLSNKGIFLSRVDSVDSSFFERSRQMVVASKIISDNFITGVGLGNYMDVLPYYSAFPYPVHNKFLMIAAETGIIGLSLFLLFWFGLIFKALAALQKKKCNSQQGAIIIASTAAVIGSFANMQTDIYALGGPPEYTLFIVAGISLGILKRHYGGLISRGRFISNYSSTPKKNRPLHQGR